MKDLADESDRQREIEERMRKKRSNTVLVQLRKVTKLVFCSTSKKLQSADLCEKCHHFHGWFQDDDGVWVKCGDVTTESKAIEVIA